MQRAEIVELIWKGARLQMRDKDGLDSAASAPRPADPPCCRCMAPLLPRRFPSFLRHGGPLRRCVLVVVLASGAALLFFQMMIGAHRETAAPPWKRTPVPSELREARDRGGQQDGREGRTERAQRIMERQIFRDDDAADHRHDESAGTESRPMSHQLPWFFKNGTEWPRPSSKLTRVANVWPEPEAPHEDRIVAQLMYLPPGYKAEPKNVNTSLKTIVLDGSWYDFLEGQALFLRDRCPVDRCRVYRGRAPEGATVDAFIFKDGYSSYYQAIREDERNQTVRILYLLENPQHTPIEKGATGIDWTATYRKDSDIVTPYEKFVLFDPLVKTIRRDHDYTQNKSKVAAWFVSNCYASNRRLEYARKLQEHIQVDIYGTCGPLECPRHTSEKCYQMVERDYYFYLAFENANCKDYITEKFFNALRHNVVPVVMGASREEYRAAAPHHSYVHVEDFRSPKELAEYLLLLSRNRTLYNEYFQWKGTGEFVNTYFWCRLCALLHAPPRPHQRRSEDVYRWWHTGACRAVNESL
ncbi:glycoprotein 3-alpha-L-fucosyltransferase A-like isoform X2 [Amblyomma americanum]